MTKRQILHPFLVSIVAVVVGVALIATPAAPLGCILFFSGFIAVVFTAPNRNAAPTNLPAHTTTNISEVREYIYRDCDGSTWGMRHVVMTSDDEC